MKYIIILTTFFSVCLARQGIAGAFEPVFLHTIKLEGGAQFTAYHYDNDGGGTKYGIAFNSFKVIAKKEGIKKYDVDKDKKITPNDLRLMTFAQARSIYKRYYWDVLKLDLVTSQLVCQNLYDFKVNGGLSIKGLQRAVKAKPDGIFGMQTVKAINFVQECNLTKTIIQNRGRWLLVTMRRTRPQTWLYCRRGWANRLNFFVSNYNNSCKNEKLDFFRL